ncbi:MAG: GDSL-type esterase/lipase family protein [Bacteroidota bacterium]
MKSPNNILLLLSILCYTACQPALKKRRILVLGDSNGAVQSGWVYQFQQLRGGGPLVNTSVSGNTIGFNGLGDERLNTLSQLVPYLRRGYAEMGAIDDVIIALGTNDCKITYADASAERHVNYRSLLEEIKKFFTDRGQSLPKIILLSPPPIDDAKTEEGEFKGAAACVTELASFISELATSEGYCTTNLITSLGDQLLKYSEDGIHFDATGYELIARELVESCYK